MTVYTAILLMCFSSEIEMFCVEAAGDTHDTRQKCYTQTRAMWKAIYRPQLYLEQWCVQSQKKGI